MNLLYPIWGCVLYMNEATRSLEPLAGHVQGERELVPCLIARVRCSDTCSSVLIKRESCLLNHVDPGSQNPGKPGRGAALVHLQVVLGQTSTGHCTSNCRR